MGAILDRAASILERRFLLNAFLPAVVFFGGYLVFFLWATGRLAGLIHSYLSARLSSQLILLVAFFALAWFSAAFISSQWRNLTRLYEGYLFAGPLHGVAAAGRFAHARRYRALTNNDESLYGEYSRNETRQCPRAAVPARSRAMTDRSPTAAPGGPGQGRCRAARRPRTRRPQGSRPRRAHAPRARLPDRRRQHPAIPGTVREGSDPPELTPHTRRAWWPPPGRSGGHRRALFVTVAGQFLMSVDTQTSQDFMSCL